MAADKTRPMRLFEVEIRGHVAHINARSRSAAVADAWRCDAFCSYSFKDFLTIMRPKARLSPRMPAPDGYDYIRRNYKVDPRIGQRVKLRDEGSFTGREGVVLYPGPSTAHVLVLIDGREHPSAVHPMNVELL